MSLWTTIETALSNGYNHVKSWIAPQARAGKEFLVELESEVERIGPQLIYDVSATALATIAAGAGGNLTTGALITEAATLAIDKLKSEGKQDVTAAVYGSLAGALLKMNATASAQGIAVPAPAPAPAPVAA